MDTFVRVALVAVTGITLAVSALAAEEVGTKAMTVDSIVHDLNYWPRPSVQWHGDVKTPYLLAFKAEVDNRPLYIESALLAVELTNGHWRLVHVYRHPKERRKQGDHWVVSHVLDIPYTGKQEYATRPTKAEVEKFISDTWWKFRARDGFGLIHGEVFSETWKKALGYAPAYQFPNPDA
jgi:hypothetical protein